MTRRPMLTVCTLLLMLAGAGCSRPSAPAPSPSTVPDRPELTAGEEVQLATGDHDGSPWRLSATVDDGRLCLRVVAGSAKPASALTCGLPETPDGGFWLVPASIDGASSYAAFMPGNAASVHLVFPYAHRQDPVDVTTRPVTATQALPDRFVLAVVDGDPGTAQLFPLAADGAPLVRDQ